MNKVTKECSDEIHGESNQNVDSVSTKTDANTTGIEDVMTIEASNIATVAEVTNSSSGRPTRAERRKRITSRNALKFGFFARELKSRHKKNEEDGTEFLRLFNNLIEDCCPVGQSELIEVELMANHLDQYKWLLRFESNRRDYAATNVILEDLEKFQRAETHILRNYYRAQSEFQRLQEIRLGKRVSPRVMLDVNAQ